MSNFEICINNLFDKLDKIKKEYAGDSKTIISEVEKSEEFQALLEFFSMNFLKFAGLCAANPNGSEEVVEEFSKLSPDNKFIFQRMIEFSRRMSEIDGNAKDLAYQTYWSNELEKYLNK